LPWFVKHLRDINCGVFSLLATPETAAALKKAGISVNKTGEYNLINLK